MTIKTSNPATFSTGSPDYTPAVIPPDVTPDAFSFNAITGAALNSAIRSNAIAVADVDAGNDIAVSVSGSGFQYEVSTDGGSSYGAATSSATNVQLGYLIRLVANTGSAYDTLMSGTLTVGGVSDSWSVTTLSEPVLSPQILSIGTNNTVSPNETVLINIQDITVNEIDHIVLVSGSNEEYLIPFSGSLSVTIPSFIPFGTYTLKVRVIA